MLHSFNDSSMSKPGEQYCHTSVASGCSIAVFLCTLMFRSDKQIVQHGVHGVTRRHIKSEALRTETSKSGLKAGFWASAVLSRGRSQG